MKDLSINREFISTLESKIPKKTLLADFVAECLCVEKETAYRRLRGEVLFSFGEIAILAQKLSLSIDKIIATSTLETNRQVVMYLPSHFKQKEDYSCEVNYSINFLENLKNQPDSEYGSALSEISFPLFLGYSNLSRFYRLKYLYHEGNPDIYVFYKDIKEQDNAKKNRKKLYNLYKQIKNTYYIWDRKIIKSLVDDIKYFYNIKLLNDVDLKLIIHDLITFLNDLEKAASNGYHEETGNKFDLYISDVNIDTTYSYLYSEKFHACYFTAFIFYATASQEKESIFYIKDWIDSLKKCSIMISDSCDKERFSFFEEQRKIIYNIFDT